MISGSDAAFLEQMYRRYAVSVRRTVAGILRTFGGRVSDDREEIVQTVFLKLTEARWSGKCAEGVAVGAYLLAIARNETWDVLAFRRRLTTIPEIPDGMLGGRPAEFENNREIATLQAYVAALPSDLKQVFALRFVEGLSQSRVCAVIGISRQNLRTLEARLKEGGIRAMAHAIPPHDTKAKSPKVSSL